MMMNNCCMFCCDMLAVSFDALQVEFVYNCLMNNCCMRFAGGVVMLLMLIDSF